MIYQTLMTIRLEPVNQVTQFPNNNNNNDDSKNIVTAKF